MNTNPAPILPHSLELEKDVLNAPLEFGRRVVLTPQHFYRAANAAVAAGINEAQRLDLSPEYPVVRQILRERGVLEDVGEVYLHTLARDGVRPSDASLSANIWQLQELARKRQVATVVLRCAEDPTKLDLDALQRDLEALRIAGSVGQRASFRTAKELAEAAERVNWMIRGYVALGAVTELTGKAKLAGKTTLLAHWVNCLLDGGRCFNEKVPKTPVVYLTEQTNSTFREVLRAGESACTAKTSAS